MSAQHVRELCDRWDQLSKGPSPTTTAINEALDQAPEIPDQVLCRTCMRPITFETRTEPGYLPREGWYDDARVDALVCFKAVSYNHVPLSDRERAYYEAGFRAGAGSSA